MQSIVQRAINALAAREREENLSGREALAEDASKTLANESDLTEKILGRFQTTSDASTRILPLVKATLTGLMKPSVCDHLLGRVKDLLNHPAPSEFPRLQSMEKQGLNVMLLPDGTIGVADPPSWSLRAEEFKPPLKEVLRSVLREADAALSNRWRICGICGRPFPQAETVAKACPVCRRKYETPLRLHRRLKPAPKDPAVFRITPPRIKEPLWLVFAPGVKAPRALRRIAHMLTTAEEAELERVAPESDAKNGPLETDGSP